MDVVNATLDSDESVLYLTATWDSNSRTYDVTGSYESETEARQAAADAKEYVLKVAVEELANPPA